MDEGHKVQWGHFQDRNEKDSRILCRGNGWSLHKRPDSLPLGTSVLIFMSFPYKPTQNPRVVVLLWNGHTAVLDPPQIPLAQFFPETVTENECTSCSFKIHVAH